MRTLASLAGTVDGIPAPPKIGVTRTEYFAILDRAGRRHGLQFSLVFMEACRGIFAPGEDDSVSTASASNSGGEISASPLTYQVD